jgi:hypothetical protein
MKNHPSNPLVNVFYLTMDHCIRKHDDLLKLIECE